MADTAENALIAALRAKFGHKLLALDAALTDAQARRRGVTYVEWPSDIEVPEGFDTK